MLFSQRINHLWSFTATAVQVFIALYDTCNPPPPPPPHQKKEEKIRSFHQEQETTFNSNHEEN